MPRFSANISTLFTEAPFLGRVALAAGAGFAAIECQFPYASPAAEFRAALRGSGLEPVLINAPPGDWAAGERGLACLPGRTTDFRESILRALEYATAIGCKLVHCMAGLVPAAVPAADLAGCYAANLAWAAARAKGTGVRIVIEPINAFDMPGYFLTRQAQAVAVIETVASPSLGLQFDAYHCARAEGPPAERIAALMPHIAHIQIADAPGRHEPGTGHIDWQALFARIDGAFYPGWVGCEYTPLGDTRDGLSWLPRFAGRLEHHSGTYS